MNVETMQQLLNVFASMGAEAKSAFIWWLMADKVFRGLVLLAVCLGAAMVIYRAIRYLIPSPTEVQVFMEVRDRYRIGTPGYLSPDEENRVAAKIRELVAKDIGGQK